MLTLLRTARRAAVPRTTPSRLPLSAFAVPPAPLRSVGQRTSPLMAAAGTETAAERAAEPPRRVGGTRKPRPTDKGTGERPPGAPSELRRPKTKVALIVAYNGAGYLVRARGASVAMAWHGRLTPSRGPAGADLQHRQQDHRARSGRGDL
jgi:hypothetical protein